MPIRMFLENVEDKYLVNGDKVFDVCPKVRLCPSCGLLIEHLTNCRWMTCMSCAYQFCFVCTQTSCKNDPHYGKCKNKYKPN